MHNRFKSVSLVALQFIFILLLLLNASVKSMPALAYVFIILSIILIFWAFAAMQKSKLRILPDPSADAVLITSGPYRFIRHPMYTAILLGCSGLLLTHFSFLSLAFIIALVIVLIIKLLWEEKMLSQKFDDYKKYMKGTTRLFPFIF
jgi:protein-S-isoprenylcysteine O-methyltransferase Ste14